MADPQRDKEVHTRDTYVEKKSGGSGMAFIVGGLVVAVAVLAYIFLGGDGSTSDVGSTSDGGGDVNVSVENPPADDTAPAADSEPASEPAPEPAEAPSGDAEPQN